MLVISPVHTEAVPGLTVFEAHGALVGPPVVVHLKVLLHVAHMTGHFATHQALDALGATLLCGVL